MLVVTKIVISFPIAFACCNSISSTHMSCRPDVDGAIPLPSHWSAAILIKINWSGLCARDKSLIHDEWAAFGVSMIEAANGIAGHKSAGVVVAVGDDMDRRWKVGDRAGIKWVVSVCGVCEFCANGQDELHFPKRTNSGFHGCGYLLAVPPGIWKVYHQSSRERQG